MAVKDIRSNLISQFMGSITVAAGATTAMAGVIDTADYELGMMATAQVTTVGTATSATLAWQESDAAAGPFVTVTDTDRIIGSGVIDVTALSIVPAATPTVTTENRMVTLGLISNLRYLQLAVVDVGGNGATVVSGFAQQMAEMKPVAEPDEAS